ncbi:MAG TPA: MlaD family protein [Longimicrobiaceae bacterium]|nr:MlaD family protein [Longimicrobiaceae bacterium]
MIQQARTAAPPPPAKRGGGNDLSSTVPMRSSRREIQIGLFFLLGIVAVVTALLMLTDPGTFRGRYDITTTVPDAGGLRKGDPVQMRGVNVGRVRGFHITQGGVTVEMEMEREYEVPADSRISMESGGLLGGMIVEVVPGRSGERVRDGAELPGTAAAGMFDMAATVGTRADTVLGRAAAMLDPRTIQAVGGSAQELQVMLTSLAGLATEQRREIALLSASLRRSAEGVESATTRPELQRAVARMDSITLQLDRSTASLNRSTGSLEAVLGRIERGEGTLGKLSSDETLYNNLNQAALSANRTASNADSLMADIKRNPRKYINLEVF